MKLVEWMGSTLRALTRAKGFSLLTVLTMGMLLCSIATSVELYRAILTSDPGVSDARDLYLVHLKDRGDTTQLPPGMQDALQATGLFESVSGFSTRLLTAEVSGQPSGATVAFVLKEYFPLLRQEPYIGRLISGSALSPDSAVISYNLWAKKFGQSPAAVGDRIAIEGRPYTIVGVTDPSFRGLLFAFEPDVTVSADSGLSAPGMRSSGQVPAWIVVRAKAHVSQSVLTEQLAARAREILGQAGISGDVTPRIYLESISHGIDLFVRKRYKRQVMILLGLNCIICAGCLFNLFLALAVRRWKLRHSTAIRIALGGSRWEAGFRTLSEVVFLGIVGCCVGALATAILTNRVLAFMEVQSSNLALHGDLTPTYIVMCGLTTVILVAVPLCYSIGWKGAVSPLILIRSYGVAGSGHTIFSAGIIAIQAALCSMLLLTTAAFTRTIEVASGRLQGINDANTVQMSLLSLPSKGNQELSPTAHRTLLQGTQALPGVTQAALSSAEVLSGMVYPQRIALTRNSTVWASQGEVFPVTSQFFPILNISRVAGATFQSDASVSSVPHAILSMSLAQQLCKNTDCLGETVSVGDSPLTKPLEVIGVVGDTCLSVAKGCDPKVLYTNYWEQDIQVQQAPYLLIRGGTEDRARSATRVAQAVRDELSRGGLEYALWTKTLSEQVWMETADQQLMADACRLFSLISAFLLIAGTVASLHEVIRRRSREVALRMAIGAEPKRVAWMLARQTILAALVGLTAGWVGYVLLLATARRVDSDLLGASGFAVEAIMCAWLLAVAVYVWIAITLVSRLSPATVLREA